MLIMSSNDKKPEDNSGGIEPAKVYHGEFDDTAPIKLRLANGGAGQSGLLRALSDAFINHLKHTTTNCKPFSIAWLTADTTESINYLSKAVADVGITYHPLAEKSAMKNGIADRREYAFRDHWMLVGPKSNEAGLIANDKTQTIYDFFSTLYSEALKTQGSEKPVRFLSRYDKSATNIKESSIWSAIGQTPWSHVYSIWYHRNVDYPFRTLDVAALLGEYTITDRGTWFAVEERIREELTIFMEGRDDETQETNERKECRDHESHESHKTNVMLNPAHALISTNSKNKPLANKFLDWLIKDDGGQDIIGNFKPNGTDVLYTRAPKHEPDSKPKHYARPPSTFY